MRVTSADLTARQVAETGVYLVLVTLLATSASAYLLARLGYFERTRSHRRVPRSTLDDHFDRVKPSMVVLVPSYKEEVRVVRYTLLSAALQEYPDLRIVLLIDDPPNPTDAVNQELLENARQLTKSVHEQLEQPRRRFEQALEQFDARMARHAFADEATLKVLANTYDEAAKWLDSTSEEFELEDHVDHFFQIEVTSRLSRDMRATADAARLAARDPNANISSTRVRQLYVRLVNTFQAEVTSFERKSFASLSHEPNKAMNLNSYIGLMGGSYAIVQSPAGPVLLDAEDGAPDLTIPDAEFLLTLDADSILLPEYCLRLVYEMGLEENSDVAVSQTPYSAFRGARSRIERIAGATTDIQHIAHQGSTQFGASFWVGANAVIRKSALMDLEKTSREGGFAIRTFISDRTVIEDTESSIELDSLGWRIYNYPERLSYSATPPDFGSLVIQRKRWANGGLVILPSLIRRIRRSKDGRPRIAMAALFLRTSYLASIAWSSIGIPLLLFYPFEGHLLSRMAILTALPYFWAMSSDLKRSGYRRRDIFRVYGLNLLLVPVNLMGTIESVVQAIGGQKMAFARTPKVGSRTVAPPAYVILPLVIMVWSAWTLRRDIQEEAYFHGAFAATNMVMMAYASVAFIGLNNIVVDVLISIRNFIYRPVQGESSREPLPDWASVIYVGNSPGDQGRPNAPLAVSLAAQDAFTGADTAQRVTKRSAGKRSTIEAGSSTKSAPRRSKATGSRTR